MPPKHSEIPPPNVSQRDNPRNQMSIEVRFGDSFKYLAKADITPEGYTIFVFEGDRVVESIESPPYVSPNHQLLIIKALYQIGTLIYSKK